MVQDTKTPLTVYDEIQDKKYGTSNGVSNGAPAVKNGILFLNSDA